MRPLRLSVAAERDLAIVFAASEAQFGEVAANRYRRLVATAFRDLRADMERPGVSALAGTPFRLYHLGHSRHRAPGRRVVARPRHVVAFRLVGGEILILRVLHDAMDIPAWLQDS